MKKKLASLTMFFSQVFMASNAFAAKDNILVSGTKALLNDILFWVLILLPVSAGAFIAWQNYLKNGLEEPAEIAQKDKLIKKYLISAVLGECSASIVKLVLSYYGVPVSDT